MTRLISILLVSFAGTLLALAADENTPIVFRSEVSLVRVDTQVVDRNNRAITGLGAEDFVLLQGGQPQQIRNFAREEMPADVLLLLDVSGSMQPHVQRVTSASHEALQVLGSEDRVAIMVFDRTTRLRMPFQQNRHQVEQGLQAVLRQETFDGGTDITRALLDAAAYIGREGRREARRAIVILTDDQTERERNEAGVARALSNANAVLSALLAPDAMRYRRGSVGGSSWPGMPGGPLGGIILGRRGGYGTRPPVVVGGGTRSAGTAEIARRSGGDSMAVDDAAALETVLARIRQRYALHFHLPEGATGQEGAIEVQLSDAARRRYPDAELRFRRIHQNAEDSIPEVTTVAAAKPSPSGQQRRRPGVSERNGPTATTPAEGGWRRVPTPETEPEPADEDEPPPQRGWRRVKPGETP